MKIRHKLLLLLLATSLLTSVLLGVGAHHILRRVVEDRYLERLSAEAGLVGSTAGRLPAADLPAFAADAGRRLSLRVTLIAADGRVLGDSAREPATLGDMENHLERPEVQGALLHGEGRSLRRSGTTGIDYLYLARRVEGDGPARFARLALPVSEIREVEGRSYGLLLVVSLGALALLSATAYAFVRRVSRPIERMSAAAAAVAGGDLRVDVAYDENDEVGRLGASVQRMKQSLLAEVAGLEEKQRLLGSVVAGMREGLLVVGPDRRVLLANRAFREIFRLGSDPEGRLVAEVVRHPAVNRDLDVVLREGRAIADSVLHAGDAGRSFELHGAPLQGGGALLMFFDITRLEALENVRRDFVANVSHELRTPLTSIKAFVETLLEGGLEDAENRHRFLEIVLKHAGRMEALIDDLTDLSLIETGAVRLALAPVDVAELAREAAEQLGHRHARLGVSVSVELPSPFLLRADRRRLEQILVNLIDNGMKFNRPGGSVRVAGETANGRAILTVADTGPGIPADSLEKVFHRFYRVDKARSREVGGTGLGLAIVKHLMRLHGGSVRVESELGRGSSFILEFPPAPAAEAPPPPAST